MEDKDIIKETEIEDSIKEDRRWCVYIHRNKINGKRYIGQTCGKLINRWGKNGQYYMKLRDKGGFHQPAFANALLKYPDWDNDWEHIVFAEGLTQEEANKIETLLIALYKTNCSKYQNPSFGYNMNDGGSNLSGKNNPNYGNHKLAGENNPMYGVRRYGKDNPNYGNHKLAGENSPNYGKVTPSSVKQKISNALLGKITQRSHLVYCIELNEIFTGSRDAERKTKIKHASIVRCCRGDLNFAGCHPDTKEKLHWLYAEDAIEQGYITQEDFDDYLNNLREKEKGDKDNGKTV